MRFQSGSGGKSQVKHHVIAVAAVYILSEEFYGAVNVLSLCDCRVGGRGKYLLRLLGPIAEDFNVGARCSQRGPSWLHCTVNRAMHF
jgi:hypothetical protein